MHSKSFYFGLTKENTRNKILVDSNSVKKQNELTRDNNSLQNSQELLGHTHGEGRHKIRENFYHHFKEGIVSDNHFMKCGLLNAAKEHITKEKPFEYSRMIKFQVAYFHRRGIEPNHYEIVCLNRMLHKFVRVVIRNIQNSSKQQRVAFQRWKYNTFGLNKIIQEMCLQKALKELEKYDMNRVLFSYKNFSRLTRTTFEAFNKWQYVVKLRYPLNHPRKGKGNVCIHDLIWRKNQKHMLLRLKAIAELKNKKVSYLAATVVTQKALEGAGDAKGHGGKSVGSLFATTVDVSKDRKVLDQVDFYRSFTVGLKALSKAVARQMREVFFSFKFIEYPFKSPAVQVLNRKYLINPKETRVSQLLPGIMAYQVFSYGYKRALLAGFKKLQGQVKLIAMQEKLKSIQSDMSLYRKRARCELITKIYLKIARRRARKSFYKWYIQTQTRRVALDIYGKAASLETKGQKVDNFTGKGAGEQDRKTYDRLKKDIEDYSEKYAALMSQTVAKNLMITESTAMRNMLNDLFIEAAEKLTELL